MGINVFVGRPLIISGGQGGGGGSVFLGSTGAQGTITSFTLSGDIDTSFTWTPQDSLNEFEFEMIGAGGAGGGSAGKSFRGQNADKVPIVTSLAAAGSGGGGGGGAYTKRTYDQTTHRGDVVYTIAVGASATGGGKDFGGFDNDQNRIGGTGGTGGITSMAADIDNVGAVVFITTGGGTGGAGGRAQLTSTGFNGCGTSTLFSAGGGGGAGGSVSTNDITGLTLTGSAVDEIGTNGADGVGTCAASSVAAGADVSSGVASGGNGGQAGMTEAQASGIAGATASATAITSPSTPGTSGGPAGGIGNNFGGGAAGGSGQTQGSNSDPNGDDTSVQVAEAGGTSAPGIVKLTFLWSGSSADQPMDSSGTVIAPD